jgi:hypothetical protein
MTTQEVANRMIELCRQGLVLQAQEELFADNVTSTEPAGSPNQSASGRAAVLAKGKGFASMIEERHDGYFGDPIVCGRFFSYTCMLDATMKGMGRMKLEEICLCEVKDGKVVAEVFYY